MQEAGLQGTTEADRNGEGARKRGGGKEVFKPSAGRQDGRRKLRKKNRAVGRGRTRVALEVSQTLLVGGGRGALLPERGGRRDLGERESSV